MLLSLARCKHPFPSPWRRRLIEVMCQTCNPLTLPTTKRGRSRFRTYILYVALIVLIAFHYMENYRNAKSVNHFHFNQILWNVLLLFYFYCCCTEQLKLFEVFSSGFKDFIYMEMWLQSHHKTSGAVMQTWTLWNDFTLAKATKIHIIAWWGLD